MKACLQMLLTGNPVPQKLFTCTETEIKDALIVLDLDVTTIRYKNIKSYVLLNRGDPLDSFLGQAFKLLRTMIYLQPDLTQQDMVDQLKVVNLDINFQDWDQVIKYFIDRDLLKYKQVTETIQYLKSTSTGDQYFNDSEVEDWLTELRLDDLKSEV